jgi:phenylacetate-CoA ligase
MLIVKGVNVFPSAIKEVIAEFKPRTTGAIEIQLTQPGPAVSSPLSIRAEYTSKAVNLEELKSEIEKTIRNKLVFRADIELVPEGVLPKTEYKAKLIKKLYEE